SGATGIGALVGLSDLGEPRQVRVRALGPDGEQTWAERAVWVRPGWETYLTLPPAARGER
ncbi:MAG: hypothetical protein PVI30_26155, partial [Myxococcales bacterium]